MQQPDLVPSPRYDYRTAGRIEVDRLQYWGNQLSYTSPSLSWIDRNAATILSVGVGLALAIPTGGASLVGALVAGAGSGLIGSAAGSYAEGKSLSQVAADGAVGAVSGAVSAATGFGAGLGVGALARAWAPQALTAAVRATVGCRVGSVVLGAGAGAAGGAVTGFASGFAGGLITTGSVQGAWETGLSEGYQGAIFGAIHGGLAGFVHPSICFVAGTQVVMGEDSVDGQYVTAAIEDIRVDDYVLARDQDDPEAPLELRRVVRTFVSTAYTLRHVAIRDDETGDVERLGTTDEHPFWVVGRGWVAAEHLAIGDRVQNPDGTLAAIVGNIHEEVPQGIEVYNFEVEHAHTYFVADAVGLVTPVWVHNTCGARGNGSAGGSAPSRPANLTPQVAGRTGGLRQALRDNGVPTSQQPSRVLPNVNRQGRVQPGRIYEYDVPAPGGGTRTVRIRDDAGGHSYGPNDPQNRGPHFNDETGGHYDY